MNYEIPLMGLAIYLLFWDKLPQWGTWFNWILAKMPRPIQYLYEAWKCPYCSGFWLGLALHATTGLWFLPKLAYLPGYWAPVDPIIGWFLDALSVGLVVLVSKFFVDVLKAHR